MGYEYVKQSRKNTKDRIVYVMGGKCQLCGYNRCRSALELHHVNPTEKEFHISRNTNLAWSKMKEEIKKCVLVCANCHREIHEQNILCTSSFDETRGLEIDEEIKGLTEHKLYYCKGCGTIISASAEQYCPTCAGIARRIVERPNREKLKKLIRNTPFTQIGTMYTVTDNAIRKWCRTEGLPSRKQDINSYSDEEWEIL